MYERFAERARKAIAYSREEALRLGQDRIDGAHILLGIVREGNGLAVAVLERMGIDLERLRHGIEEVSRSSADANVGVDRKIEFAMSTKRILELAQEEAREFGDKYIDTEHMLLGLIREGEGVAARLLASYEVTLARARDVAIDLRRGVLHRPVGRTSSADDATSYVRPQLDGVAAADLLGRRAFARALAAHIEAIRVQYVDRDDADTYVVHLQGPWGSGKSTVLRFLRDELANTADSRDYLVVEFNAWKHQRLKGPWWWLLRNTYVQVLAGQKGFAWAWLLLRNAWWRMGTGLGPYVLALAVMYVFVILGVFREFDWLARGSALAVFVCFLAVFKWAIWGSAKAADLYVEYTGDPMRLATEYFRKLLQWVKKPVVVLVDEMDRCSGEYNVEFLEGLQTIFRGPNVFFVVACDRNWIVKSFDMAYGALWKGSEEQGLSVGQKFLEKTFQMSVAVPSMSVEMKERYWGSLLNATAGNAEVHASLEDERRKRIEKIFSLPQSERDVLDGIEKVKQDSDLRGMGQYARELAARKLAAPLSKAESEHLLAKVTGDVDPNPRSMKRYINTYALSRALVVLGGHSVSMDQLAYWIVIVTRWPVIAELVGSEGWKGKKKPPVGVSPAVGKLLETASVRAVLRHLPDDVARECARISGFGDVS